MDHFQCLVWMTLTRMEHVRKISTYRFVEKVEIERREISSILDIFSWKQCLVSTWILSPEWRYDLKVITIKVVVSVMRMNNISHKGLVE